MLLYLPSGRVDNKHDDLSGLSVCDTTIDDRSSRPTTTISRRLISSVMASRKVMSASTPSAIISALRPAFEKGKESGDLLFFPSQVHTHQDLGIDVGHLAPSPPLARP